MSKLTNLKGRINYISSHVRQENLYAVYETTDRNFWTGLAKCNQEEFIKSGTDGKCIEARELIIALPESFVDYEQKALLKLFTEHFKQNYGTECIAALHHNKRKTNYHVHLIFSERKLLDAPVEKIASRNMFYDEVGKHRRTRKEILDADGQIRTGCRVIPKGEVYERNIFTTKDARFKSENFLDEVKCSYTALINIYVKEETERLQVFDKHGVYLPMKKIGKNNPKAEQIKSDNQMRQKWNQTVDRALIGGITEEKVTGIKQTEITDKVKASIRKQGRQPQFFESIVRIAIVMLQILISQIFKKASPERTDKLAEPTKGYGRGANVIQKSDMMNSQEKTLPKSPVKPALAEKYSELVVIYQELNKQNYAIHQQEQKLSEIKGKLENTRGFFKGKQRKELQEEINGMVSQIDRMKEHLSNIVGDYGYKNVKEFLTVYVSSETAYKDYQKAMSERKRGSNGKKEPESVREKLAYHVKNVKERENSKKQMHSHSRERGAR